MNCDRIAPWYEWLEKAAFGGKLQRHRVAFLDAAKGKQRALVLGDGDGRFTDVLATEYPALDIDYLDASAGMVAEASKRLAAKQRVHVMQGDALEFAFSEANYPIIYTHFFLDCFDTETVSTLVRRLSPFMTPEAIWVVSDFSQAASGWRRIYTELWLFIMYGFFRYATGLITRSLPDYGSALESAGFRLQHRRVSMAGLIASERWER